MCICFPPMLISLSGLVFLAKDGISLKISVRIIHVVMWLTIYFLVATLCATYIVFVGASSNYKTTLLWESSSNWQTVHASPLNTTFHSLLLRNLLGNEEQVRLYASKPVLASLTSISSRIQRVHRGILTLLRGFIVPHQIYLFVSQLPFLIDEGVRYFPNELLCLASAGYVRLVYTENIGPHRKLLPLLEQRYKDDVLIATVDDDLGLSNNSTMLFRLLQAYEHVNGTSIVALRSRRIGLCLEDSRSASRYRYWSLANSFYHPEMLSVPTGTGGVLYHPRHMHPMVFDGELRHLTGTADDLMFRLTSMLNNVSVVVGCSDKRDQPCPHISTVVHTRAVLLVDLRGASSTDTEVLGDHGKPGSPESMPVIFSANTSTTSISNSTVYTYDNRKVQSLFVINIRGQNDASWRRAVQYLKAKVGFDWRELLAKYYNERERICYDPLATRRWKGVQCAIWPCNHQRILYI